MFAFGNAMWPHAITATMGLVGASLLSKFFLEGGGTPGLHGAQLLREAMHLRTLAQQDSDPAVKLFHYAQASAYVQSARTFSRDAELEQSSGLDVTRLSRAIDHQILRLREQLSAPSTK